jgi:hypothetical protein
MSGFDNRKAVRRTADAESFTATITEGSSVCSASITYKKGFKVGPPGITTRTMDELMAALGKQDKTVRFYKRANDAGALSAKDAATLEKLRHDPNTSDQIYRNACRSFGQQPQARNITNTATVASKASAPQAVTPFLESATAWQEFEQAHGELWARPYGDMNVKLILQFLQDENMQVTRANLAQAHRELKAANCFRSPNTLSRNINGSLSIVQPYSHERIVGLRKQQAMEAATAPPAHLSDVDREAWNAVHAKYPLMPVGSPAFKKCCADTVLLWATEYAKEQQPELAAANKRGELRKAVDAVVMQWSRQANPRANQSLSQRIWLGAIFF